jgi:hypothetical protein
MMPTKLALETADGNLKHLLARLKLGDTLTRVNAEGMPEALLVSLKGSRAEPETDADWEARWDELAQEISIAWQSEASALDILSDMRR